MAKNPHAQALGRLGGAARAAALTPAQRAKIAQKAGEAGGAPKDVPWSAARRAAQDKRPKKPAS